MYCLTFRRCPNKSADNVTLTLPHNIQTVAEEPTGDPAQMF